MTDNNSMTDNNTDNKQQSEWQKRELGALWLKQSSSQKYFSGHVKVDDGFGGEKLVNLVVFSNRNKTKPNQPDFRIYRSKDRDEEKKPAEAEPETASVSSETDGELL